MAHQRFGLTPRKNVTTTAAKKPPTQNGFGRFPNLRGGIEYMPGTLNAERYLALLKEQLPAVIRQHGLQKSRLEFQQDNASPHTARFVYQWFIEEGITLMKWPAHSPDLNPIENLWALLKKRVGARARDSDGVFDLWALIEEEWGKITINECRKLVHSMPDRIQAVIKARGGYTKY